MLGTATALPADASVDLVLCTGNAIMHLDPDEFRDALQRIAAALRAGGWHDEPVPGAALLVVRAVRSWPRSSVDLR